MSQRQDKSKNQVKPTAPSINRKEWRPTFQSISEAPTLMLLNVVCGVALALGHHYFYRHFDGRSVEGSPLSQDWIIRFGTAFAFLVKVSFVLATGAVYVQLLWHSFQKSSSKVNDIDMLFNALENFMAFFRVKIWVPRPLVLLLAVVTWGIPIISIITPGAITVDVRSRNVTTNLPVPQVNLNLDGERFGRTQSQSGGPNQFNVNPSLQQNALASAGGGRLISPAAPPGAPNSSYQLDFFAPRLVCAPPTSDQLGPSAFKHGMNGNQIFNMSITGGGPIHYLAFMPADRSGGGCSGSDCDSESSDGAETGNGTSFSDPAIPNPHAQLGGSAFFGDYLDHLSMDSAKIFFAFYVNEGYTYDYRVCSLWNASYSMDFVFYNGAADVNLMSQARSNLANPISTAFDFIGSTTNEDSQPPATNLSSAGLLSAYGRIVNGMIASTVQGDSNTQNTLIQSTNIAPFLGAATRENNIRASDMLEPLFFNMTMSLFSNPYFTQSPSSSRVSNVTITLTEQYFHYDPTSVYICYGIGLLVTLLSITIGSLVVARNGGSYSSNFSTIVRTTANSGLEAIINSSDSHGMAPVPRKLAESKIRLSSKQDTMSSGFRLEKAPLLPTKE